MRSHPTWWQLFEPIKNLLQIARTNKLFWNKNLIVPSTCSISLPPLSATFYILISCIYLHFTEPPKLLQTVTLILPSSFWSYSLVRRSFYYVCVTRAGNIRRITPIENSASLISRRRCDCSGALQRGKCNACGLSLSIVYIAISRDGRIIPVRQEKPVCEKPVLWCIYLRHCIDLF